jgi:hypothetical protein
METANVKRKQYVVFDRATGRILQTRSKLDADSEQFVDLPIEELKREAAADADAIGRVTGKDPANIAVVAVDADGPVGYTAQRVDPKTHKLVDLPRLRLTADKTELAGDGSDTATIEVQAVDAKDKPVRDVEGEVRVTTERGKLSERGGLIKLVRGHGKIKLTSVNETVHRVRVRAESLDGSVARGDLRFEFV